MEYQYRLNPLYRIYLYTHIVKYINEKYQLSFEQLVLQLGLQQKYRALV